MDTLTNQTAIVTGAGSGIGAGIASVLGQDGATVVVVDLDGDKAAAAVAAIESRGGKAIAHVCDVTNDAEVRTLVRDTVDRTGRIDILASNAGIYPTATIEQTSELLWDKVMDVNLKASFLLMRAVAPVMRRQHYGRIVVTSSVTGPRTAMVGLSHYCASKAGAIGLVRCAALEFARDGITVNAVLPGTVDTEGLRSSSDVGEHSTFLAAMLPSIPQGRIGKPVDIGWAVRLFASPEASYVTGQELIVDGGQGIVEGGDAGHEPTLQATATN